jgi:hypothetical protein
LLLTGCDAASRSAWVPKVLESGEHLSRTVQRAITSRRSMAQEFSEADLSPYFRSNGTDNPSDPEYQALARDGFVGWRLRVEGLVERPVQQNSARCAAARRSRGTTASKAGARSASGPAFR